jgi:hypothetical protein
MNELDRILDGLIQRTFDGKLKWSRAVSDDQFATSVDTISVLIGKSSRLQRGVADQPRLEIYNERGDLAEVMQFDRPSTGEMGQIQRLNQLHGLARRSALDTQTTLEKLAKALET